MDGLNKQALEMVVITNSILYLKTLMVKIKRSSGKRNK